MGITEKLAAIITAAVSLLSGCFWEARSESNSPPDPDTPEPPAHAGIFVSEYGTLDFAGDGKTVTASFTGEASEYIESGEMQYEFRWETFGKCRYDTATRLVLFGESSYTFLLRGASEDKISLIYAGSDPKLELVFEKYDETDYDGPPAGIEEAAPLTGMFSGEYGSLTFNGDGKSVSAKFRGDAAKHLKSGDMEYAFWWDSFGICGYNEATEMELSLGEEIYSFTVISAAENALELRYVKFDGKLEIIADLDMTFRTCPHRNCA